jgi:hypothetical protein
MRSLRQPRGKDGITATQREFCDSQNVLLDFGIECLWAAFRSNISVTGEFPCFRGAKGVPPKRAYWEAKEDYATVEHFKEFKSFMVASGARLFRFAGCGLGFKSQKYLSVVAWPNSTAKVFDHLDGLECAHVNHAELAVGEKATESKVYPPALDELFAEAHLHNTHLSVDDSDATLMQMFHSALDGTIRVLMDNGASDSFFPTDEFCTPGTDGPATVTNVMVGKKKANLDVVKSCMFHWGIPIPYTDRVRGIRVNIAPDVPMPVMAEG